MQRSLYLLIGVGQFYLGGMKYEWKKFYRAAILESDPRKLPKRVADARVPILDRSRKLTDSPAVGGDERDSIVRALHILSLLDEGARKP
jgi:hypothetical protein